MKTMNSDSFRTTFLTLTLAFTAGFTFQSVGADETPDADSSQVKWISLLNQDSLCGWKTADYAGHGPVSMEEGAMILGMGNCMTGATYTNDFPFKINYEIQLKAKRVSGSDFFCALTFPVNEDPCSLIIGGWGGGLVGISNLDGQDASQNETTSFRKFDNNRWYTIRMRVEDNRMQAWIDEDQVVDVVTTNRKISIRPEVDLSRPLGLGSWCTTAAIKDIKIRQLTPKSED
jgi:hypothetical protein